MDNKLLAVSVADKESGKMEAALGLRYQGR